MTETQSAPNLQADAWGIFAGYPPNLDGQKLIAATFRALDSPQAKSEILTDKGLLPQKVFFIHYPVVQENQRHSTSVEAIYELILMSRRLVMGAPTVPVPPLDENMRQVYLASASDADYEIPIFRTWLKSNNLVRQKEESDLAFAYRALSFIGEHFTYKWVIGSPNKASEICNQGWSHCGPLTALFVATMRANGIPARMLFGRWAKSSGEPTDLFHDRDHVKGEFFADGIGWVPVDTSGAVSSKNIYRNFGQDKGDHIVLNIDGVMLDKARYFQLVQVPWAYGKYRGSWNGFQSKRDMKVEDLSSQSAGTAKSDALAVEPIQAEFIPHPKDANKKVEFFWSRPTKDGPWPVLIYIHGHQPGHEGGAAWVEPRPIIKFRAANGMVVVAVSQPGYGHSEGPADFCGPFTQAAVQAVIDHFRKLPFVDPSKIALYGYSRGAVVASNVATQDPKLAVLILGGGTYDLKDAYGRMTNAELKKNIESEAGVTDEAFAQRSALLHADNIKAPTLILQGEKDEKFPPDQAQWMKDKIQKSGTYVKAVIFPGAPHEVPFRDLNREIDPFLAQYLLKKAPYQTGNQF